MPKEIAQTGLSTHSREVRGLILGGGKGSRLHPLTAETSKHLLPIGDKPMILRVIDQLLEADVKDLLLLIDQRFASQFMDLLHDGSHLGIRSLAYIWQSPEGRGLPSAIAQMEPFVERGRIVVACGDVLIDNGIRGPVSDFLSQRSGARLTTTFMSDTAGYSPLEVQGKKVKQIISKDKERHTPGLIDLGIYMYHPEVFEQIKNLRPSARGETEIWELNQRYADLNRLNFSVIDGWWSDTGGSIETYLAAHKHYENK
jgi:glucose-1-phosphate thymidylyltransferase